MTKFQITVIIIAVLIAVVAIFSKLKYDFKKKLEDTLYKNSDPKKYLELLDSNQGKLFVQKKDRELLKLDVYQMCNDKVNMFKQFDKISKYSLSLIERVNLCNTKLFYYIKDGETDLAKKTIDEINSIKVNDDKAKSIIAECNIAYRLNVLHDASLEKELLENIDKQTDEQKFLTYIRLAKLSYFNKKKDAIDEYLNKAKALSKNKDIISVVNKCINDNSNLENI